MELMSTQVADSGLGAGQSGWWYEARSEDVDQHASQLQSWDWRCDQLSSGSFGGTLVETRLPHVQVYRELLERRTRQRGLLPPDCIGLAMPWNETGVIWANGMQVDGDHVFACHGSEIDICTPLDADLGYFIVDGPVIDAALACMGGPPRLTDPADRRIYALAPEVRRRLRQLMTLAHGAPGRAPLALREASARALLSDQIVLEIVEALSGMPSPEERNAAQRKRLVDRACELMLSQQDAPMSVLEVCKVVGASRSKLNYCFQEALGTTPAAYLRAVRLNAVRRELRACRDPERGVYDIAARWGFWHFGQFSQDYKKHFAELPSQTLARARLAPPPDA